MESRHRILIVEDDLRVRTLLVEYLELNGFQPFAVATAGELRAQMRAARPDLVLLDLGLPDADGLALTNELRNDSDTPIIIITGRIELMDRVVGLELGADDYISKPFEQRELLARIRSVLRRYQSVGEARPANSGSGEILEFDGWQLDRARYHLTNPAGEEVTLTSHEFHLLDILTGHAQRVLSRARILELSNKREWMPYDRSVDMAVAKLRKKLEPNPANPALIKTVRNLGYLFTARVVKRRGDVSLPPTQS